MLFYILLRFPLEAKLPTLSIEELIRALKKAGFINSVTEGKSCKIAKRCPQNSCFTPW